MFLPILPVALAQVFSNINATFKPIMISQIVMSNIYRFSLVTKPTRCELTQLTWGIPLTMSIQDVPGNLAI